MCRLQSYLDDISLEDEIQLSVVTIRMSCASVDHCQLGFLP